MTSNQGKTKNYDVKTRKMHWQGAHSRRSERRRAQVRTRDYQL